MDNQPTGPAQTAQAPSQPSRRGRTRPTLDFRPIAPEVYEADLNVSEPHSIVEGLRRVIFGLPIPERLARGERLNRVRALAILSSDALSSVAYGTEASLAILVAAGAFALSQNLIIGLVTAVLMLMVGASYRQTIHAYPNGGGSYIVARSNLGIVPGLVAGGALLIDYLLTVSVSVSSGIDAISSAIPSLIPIRLELDLAAILLIVLVNLRGLREAGSIFALPTYLFLASYGLMIVFGLVRAITDGGLTNPIVPAPSALPVSLQPLTLLLVLTAFASGASAMTGVEAISNGVPVFSGDSPKVRAKHAGQTLTVMIALLVTFFLGTTYLAWRSGAVPTATGTPTVTAQIAQFAYTGVFGWLFYVVQAATLLILVFAANTSFNGFPRLAAILSRDGFLPAFFAYRGERLAFSTGIVTLGGLSALIVWVFRGNVVALINLYAVGVFTAFTLSQSGMVIHWLRLRRTERGWLPRLLVNALGALATGIVTLVIAFTKFDRGAWVVVLLIPLLVLFFLAIHRYYVRPKVLRLPATPSQTADVAILPLLSHQDLPDEDQLRQLAELRQGDDAAADSTDRPPPATETKDAARELARHRAWLNVIEREVAFAAASAPNVEVIRIVHDAAEADAFRDAWRQISAVQRTTAGNPITAEALISPYRTTVLPLANFIEWRASTELAGKSVVVLLPHEQNAAWWEFPLRLRVAHRLRTRLRRRGSPVTVQDVPYTLDKA